ncbi:MAG: hypothetical protein EXS05_17585 [Planctomycetaceae bacterium]|nr:hypothetical protein [Planctomycetaceae bacterium]
MNSVTDIYVSIWITSAESAMDELGLTNHGPIAIAFEAMVCLLLLVTGLLAGCIVVRGLWYGIPYMIRQVFGRWDRWAIFAIIVMNLVALIASYFSS